MKSFIFFPTILLLLLFTVSCQKELDLISKATPQTTTTTKSLTTTPLNLLRLDQVTFKGSHNSYERRELITEQVSFNPSKPHDDRCYGLEFDIWRNSSSFTPGGYIRTSYWTVNHWFNPGSRGKKLSDYLGALKTWHNNNPNHLPVLIKLDIKSSNGGSQNLTQELDTYIKRYLTGGNNNLLYTPGNVLSRNTQLTLSQNIKATGWPTINALRGKFIIVLTGNQQWGTNYINNQTNSRSCFFMKNLDAGSQITPTSYGSSIINSYANRNIVFFNFNIDKAQGNETRFEQLGLYFSGNKMITRCYTANNSSEFNLARKSGISYISTDKVRNHSWARAEPNANVAYARRKGASH